MSAEASPHLPPTPKQRVGSEILLVITTILWGSTFIVTNTVTQIIPPMFYMGVRYLVAALAMLPFAKRLKVISKEQLKIALIAGLMNWASFALQTVGIKLTSAAKSGFITGLNITMVPLFMAVIFKKKISVKIWISTALALIGIIVMSFVSFDRVEVGDILILGCDVIYALFIIFLGQNAKKIDPVGFSILVLFQISVYSFLTSVIFEPWSHIFGELSPVIFTFNNLLIFLYIGAIATMIAQLTQVFGQVHVPSARAAIIFALEPIFATLFAVIFGEIVSHRTIIGGIIIILSIFVSIDRPKDDEKLGVNSSNQESPLTRLR